MKEKREEQFANTVKVLRFFNSSVEVLHTSHMCAREYITHFHLPIRRTCVSSKGTLLPAVIRSVSFVT